MKTEEQMEKWRQARHYTPAQLETARAILDEVRSGIRLDRALRSHPMPDGTLVAKHILVAAYHELVDEGEWPEDPSFLARIRMKPVRTLSGVTM
jgi:elongator complex protein 3